jgi:hypothetical protein
MMKMPLTITAAVMLSMSVASLAVGQNRSNANGAAPKGLEPCSTYCERKYGSDARDKGRCIATRGNCQRGK